MRHRSALRRSLGLLLGLAVAAGLGTVASVAGTAADPEPAHASSVGGTITRSEVLERAQYWVDKRYTYSQTSWVDDPAGRAYRADCSGLVSMAWHLGASYTTYTFPDSGTITYLGSLHDLKPGDAILKTDHMELFSHWKNPSDHTDGAYVYSFNTGGETVRNPYAASNYGNRGFNSWSEMNTFDPIRYKNIRDDRPEGTASVYGVLGDGTVTYTSINASNGNRIETVTSSAVLGFTPKAMATLNFNTLVVASTAGDLYRVDINTNRTVVTFDKTKVADSGWAYDHLAYDGHGHLFGISDGTLRRFIVSVGEHSFRVTDSSVVGTGFVLKTLTATGNNWILGTTADGKLRSYKIGGDQPWTGYTLKSSGWSGVTHLLSPGGGAYYVKYRDGSMYHYFDGGPYDGDGGDIAYYLDDPVDERGWTQVLLSAQPRTVS